MSTTLVRFRSRRIVSGATVGSFKRRGGGGWFDLIGTRRGCRKSIVAAAWGDGPPPGVVGSAASCPRRSWRRFLGRGGSGDESESVLSVVDGESVRPLPVGDDASLPLLASSCGTTGGSGTSWVAAAALAWLSSAGAGQRGPANVRLV